MSLPTIKHSEVTKTYTTLVPGSSQPMDTIPSLGEERIDTNGKIYKFVKNNHSVAAAIGDLAVVDLTNNSSAEVKQPTTATLNLLAGVHVATIPAAGYGWLQIYGDNDSTLVEGTTDIVLGDSLKAVNAQNYAVKDAATGTESTYARHLLAREGFTTNGTGLKKVTIRCR